MLLTPEQLAERLQRPARTLSQWRYRGEGPSFHKVGGAVRYDETDVDAWLEAQRIDLTRTGAK